MAASIYFGDAQSNVQNNSRNNNQNNNNIPRTNIQRGNIENLNSNNMNNNYNNPSNPPEHENTETQGFLGRTFSSIGNFFSRILCTTPNIEHFEYEERVNCVLPNIISTLSEFQQKFKKKVVILILYNEGDIPLLNNLFLQIKSKEFLLEIIVNKFLVNF